MLNLAYNIYIYNVGVSVGIDYETRRKKRDHYRESEMSIKELEERK